MTINCHSRPSDTARKGERDLQVPRDELRARRARRAAHPVSFSRLAFCSLRRAIERLSLER